MPKIDLRAYKKEIRNEMRHRRQALPPEAAKRKDESIYHRVLSLSQYKKAKTVVLYVSKELEVDTRRLMMRALRDGKQVAVPRCVENSRLMNMHLIHGKEDLVEGSYGILEPREIAPILQETRNAICIVPAFCNDYQGYRVGYGGGYYDRYLSTFRGTKVGINYAECVRPRLISGRYDIPLDLLVTDKYIRKCRRPRAGAYPLGKSHLGAGREGRFQLHEEE